MKILYISTVNWKWIKQRPHFIATYLAKQGNEVDYISLNPFGKTQITRHIDGTLRVQDMYVLPFSLKSRLVEKWNISIVKSRLLDKKYDIIVLTSPLHYQYLPDFMVAECSLIYECMDNIPFFYDGVLRERMLAEEHRTLEVVDGVIVSSNRLKEELEGRTNRKDLSIRTIYNAIDRSTFESSSGMIELNKPNLVYIGTVAPWLDWELLNEFALRHPDFTIYLVGPCDFNKLPRKMKSNIVLTGAVPHKQVPEYIRSGDIMLLPFIRNELTESVDPVKLYEYIGMSKPIVSAYWPELERFNRDGLHFYEDLNQFESILEEIDTNRVAGINQGFIDQHNWENRAAEYLRYLKLVVQSNNMAEGLRQ